jgi:hypothetical protein
MDILERKSKYDVANVEYGNDSLKRRPNVWEIRDRMRVNKRDSTLVGITV